MSRVERFGLQIDKDLYNFLESEALPGTDITADQFWHGWATIVHDLGPRNRTLLAKRDALQKQIDDWHLAHRDQEFSFRGYKAFLTEIGYLVEKGAPFAIETVNVDPEIATIAEGYAIVRDIQRRALAGDADAQGSSTDPTGNSYIHPAEKLPVAEYASRWALAY